MGRFRIFALLLAAGLVFAGSDAPAIGNFHQVDERIYRGAQPAAPDFRSLARMGVKTILDLREGEEHARAEQELARAAGLQYVNVPMSGLGPPTAAQTSRALAVLQDAASGPVFVHCLRGADRTGTVIACYRIAHDQWPNQKALDEALTFGMSWTERGMRNYVLHYEAIQR
jgi:protein tyrosine/serine phosphatase